MGAKTVICSLLLAVVACGQPATTSTSQVTEIDVLMTATPIRSGDQIELCPPGMLGRCPGVFLEGDLPAELISPAAGPAIVIEIEGSYDGRRLLPARSASVIEDYPALFSGDFASKCPEMRGGGNPESNLEAINSYTQTVPDDFAGMWWDQESAVMTVWFVGDDVEPHRRAIEAAVGEHDVCVAGGARFSERELVEAMELLGGLTGGPDPEVVTGGYGIDTVGNRVNLPVQEIDAAIRSQITETVGDRVAVYPYMELIVASLSELPEPVPVVPGNVDLIRSRLRFGGGMDALGRFMVGYDAGLNCIYFDGTESGSGGRTVPVWPFGYSAVNDPVEVYDYDGGFIAGQGTVLELGGGFADVALIQGNTCGATSAWIVNG